MKWFKAVHFDREEISEIVDKHGFDGYGKFIAVLSYCQENNYKKITPDLIVKALRGQKINIRSAAKLCPMFQESLVKVSKMFGQSLPNVSPNIDECLPNVSPMFDQTEAENPCGRNKNLETRLEENRIDPPTPQGEVCESADLKKSVELAAGYAGNSLSNQTIHWVSPYLRGFYVLNRSKWQALTDSDIATCWEKACKFWDKGKPYIQKVFERELQEFTPDKRLSLPKQKGMTWGEKLLAAPRIWHKYEHYYLETKGMTLDHFRQACKDGYPIDQTDFEPCYEEVSA